MSLTFSELLALEGLSALRLRRESKAAAGRTLVLRGGKMNISPSGSWRRAGVITGINHPRMKPT
ncbi:transcriptional regulatory protein [Klebsiella pneumoniae]|nr:transcriptional regulatory protein [Klebsiella pneumoniae]